MDKFKADEVALQRTNPKSARLQPYKSQYMRLCKVYVDVMKDHQQAKVGCSGRVAKEWLRGRVVIGGAVFYRKLCMAPWPCAGEDAHAGDGDDGAAWQADLRRH